MNTSNNMNINININININMNINMNMIMSKTNSALKARFISLFYFETAKGFQNPHLEVMEGLFANT